MDVVLGGKNINLTLERLPLVGCAGQLSIINAIYQFSLRNFLTHGPIPQIEHYLSNFSVVTDINMVVILHF